MMIEYLHGMLKPVAALAVVFMAISLSRFQKLNIERDMVYSVCRGFVQLSIIGFVLQFIFRQTNSLWILVAYLFMVRNAIVCSCLDRVTRLFTRKMVAGMRSTAGWRAKHVPLGKYIAGISILTGTSVTMSLLLLLRVFPFAPRYVIPIAGMMVGNAMNATGVTMKRLRDDIKLQMNEVETALALGANPKQATIAQVKRALVIGLTPVLDSAKTVGLISLPGAMTGLIMGGASPLEAIQLQIVVMNMTIGASTISSMMSIFLSWPNLFTYAYQLETNVFTAE